MKPISILLFSFSICLAGFCQDIGLAWNASQSTNVQAYRIYAWTNNPVEGFSITNANQMIQVGNVTSATLTAMNPAQYHFGATAVITNGLGGESSLSNIIAYEVPNAVVLNVQTSTNVIDWQDSPVFLRLKRVQ